MSEDNCCAIAAGTLELTVELTAEPTVGYTTLSIDSIVNSMVLSPVWSGRRGRFALMGREERARPSSDETAIARRRESRTAAEASPRPNRLEAGFARDSLRLTLALISVLHTFDSAYLAGLRWHPPWPSCGAQPLNPAGLRAADADHKTCTTAVTSCRDDGWQRPGILPLRVVHGCLPRC